MDVLKKTKLGRSIFRTYAYFALLGDISRFFCKKRALGYHDYCKCLKTG